jgi:hypothetical protein
MFTGKKPSEMARSRVKWKLESEIGWNFEVLIPTNMKCWINRIEFTNLN